MGSANIKRANKSKILFTLIKHCKVEINKLKELQPKKKSLNSSSSIKSSENSE